MLTVIIPTLDSEPVLAATLASLVTAAADGVVREVMIADGGSRDATAEIADATGCAFFEGHGPGGMTMREGARLARRGEWLLFLSAGVSLEAGWHHDAAAFVERAERAGRADRAAIFRFSVDDLGLSARLAETGAMLERWLCGIPRDAQGLLISRRFYEKLGGHRASGRLAAADLARRIGRHRLHELRARACFPREIRPAAITAPGWQRWLIASGCPARLLAGD